MLERYGVTRRQRDPDLTLRKLQPLLSMVRVHSGPGVYGLGVCLCDFRSCRRVRHGWDVKHGLSWRSQGLLKLLGSQVTPQRAQGNRRRSFERVFLVRTSNGRTRPGGSFRGSRPPRGQCWRHGEEKVSYSFTVVARRPCRGKKDLHCRMHGKCTTFS